MIIFAKICISDDYRGFILLFVHLAGFEGAPQVGQKRFPVPAFTPHLTQTTALLLISLPQFLQYIIKMFTIPAPQYGVLKNRHGADNSTKGTHAFYKIQSIHPLYSRTIPSRKTRQHISAEQRVFRKFMTFFFSLHIFCKKIRTFFQYRCSKLQTTYEPNRQSRQIS